MPTLPDYLGVSRIQNESPGLPYSLLDTKNVNFDYYFGQFLGKFFEIFDVFL